MSYTCNNSTYNRRNHLNDLINTIKDKKSKGRSDKKDYYKLSINFSDICEEDDIVCRPYCCMSDDCDGKNVSVIIALSKDEKLLDNLADVVNSIDMYDMNEYKNILNDEEIINKYEDLKEEYGFTEEFQYDLFLSDIYGIDSLLGLFWEKVYEEWKIKYNFIPNNRLIYRTCHKTHVEAKVELVRFKFI